MNFEVDKYTGITTLGCGKLKFRNFYKFRIFKSFGSYKF